MELINLDINKTPEIGSDFFEKLLVDKDFEINIDFVSDFKSAKLLRNFVSSLSEKISIDNIWKSRLILVADELNNNAIEYWSKSWEMNLFKITITHIDKGFNLNIEVHDTWNWPKAKKSFEMEEMRDNKKKEWFSNHNSIRGRGLFMIIEKLVDELYFKDSESWWLIVWINKKFEAKTD